MWEGWGRKGHSSKGSCRRKMTCAAEGGVASKHRAISRADRSRLNPTRAARCVGCSVHAGPHSRQYNSLPALAMSAAWLATRAYNVSKSSLYDTVIFTDLSAFQTSSEIQGSTQTAGWSSAPSHTALGTRLAAEWPAEWIASRPRSSYVVSRNATHSPSGLQCVAPRCWPGLWIRLCVRCN